MNRAKQDPAKYIHWYLIGKSLTYWSWNTLFGQKGPFIYQAKFNIYFSNDFVKYTLTLYEAIHPIFVLLSLVGLIFLLRDTRKSNFDTSRDFAAPIVIGCIVYFTAIHMVFAPLPRYSIPVHPLIYLAGLYSISKWIEFKNNSFKANAS
jgi:hypothetical protein